MKNCYILSILTVLMLFGCRSQHNWLEAELSPALYIQEGTKELTSVDPEDKGFGGGRGFGQLIVYTHLYGERTGTNCWGIEAVVINGQVVSVGGNDSPIPENGFVISGNESGREWILENLTTGMKVELQGQTIHYTYTENSAIARARDYYQRTLERLDKGKMSDRSGIKKANRQLQNDFNALLEAKASESTEATVQCSRLLTEHAQNLYYSSYEPRKDEFRGIWIRLKDTTPEELKATIKTIAAAGFNAIVPETIYNGYAIYPDAHPLLPQLPQFEGWDPMQLMIDECSKYGVAVVPWCEIFFVGQAKSPMVKQKPEWIGKFRTGNMYSELEPSFYYLCPSQSEPREYLLAVIDTLISRYPLQHIQYDYIRYSKSIPWDKGYCYCDTCRSKVQQMLGFDIMNITPEDTNEWAQWNEYRINNITSFVEESSQILKKKHPGVKLSVDVVSDPEESLKYKFQDWSSWVKNNLVDEVYIMNYYVDNTVFRNDTKNLKEVVSGTDIKAIVGIAPFMNLRPEELLEQIEITRENGAGGVCLFAYNSMNEEQLKALAAGPFRRDRNVKK